jgi:hypothetical protein
MVAATYFTWQRSFHNCKDAAWKLFLNLLFTYTYSSWCKEKQHIFLTASVTGGTAWSTVFLQRLTVARLMKSFGLFGTRRFVTVLTRGGHMTLFSPHPGPLFFNDDILYVLQFSPLVLLCTVSCQIIQIRPRPRVLFTKVVCSSGTTWLTFPPSMRPEVYSHVSCPELII